MSPETAADEFCRRLDGLRSPDGEIPMRDIFALAKELSGMQPSHIEVVLAAPDHLARVGAVSIMDFQARDKATSESRRRELYELYLGRHDLIDTWDLVDRAAPYVVGGYLADKAREPLYALARSTAWPERRTAIVATYFFIRQGEVRDTFAIGDVLAHDPVELVQKAVGGWVREAGKRDPEALLAYLDRHARTMPRTALRYAIERLEPTTRGYYLGLRTGDPAP